MKNWQQRLCKLIKDLYPDDDSEVIEYGLYILISKIIFIITIVIIGIIFNELAAILLFTLLYTPLRSFAGGIHAETSFRCYILSLVMLICVILAEKYIYLNSLNIYILLLISTFLIIFLSPVETYNKPLDNIEKMVYRKKTTYVLAFEIFVGLVSKILSFDAVLSNVMYAFVMVSFMLILGILKNKIVKGKHGGRNEA